VEVSGINVTGTSGLPGLQASGAELRKSIRWLWLLLCVRTSITPPLDNHKTFNKSNCPPMDNHKIY